LAARGSAIPQAARLTNNSQPTNFPAPRLKQVMNRWLAIAFLLM
jgi:hypothetical protein